MILTSVVAWKVCGGDIGDSLGVDTDYLLEN